MDNEQANKTTYKIDVWCKNCGHRDEVDIEKGRRIEEVSCPSCGCMEIERDLNPHLKKNRRPTSYI